MPSLGVRSPCLDRFARAFTPREIFRPYPGYGLKRYTKWKIWRLTLNIFNNNFWPCIFFLTCLSTDLPSKVLDKQIVRLFIPKWLEKPFAIWNLIIIVIKNKFYYSIPLIGSYYVQGFGIPKKCDKIGLDSDRPTCYYAAQCGVATSTLTQNSSVFQIWHWNQKHWTSPRGS